MADDRLNLEARFNDLASAGVRKLGKTLEGVKPSNGMQAASKWMGDFRREADGVLRAVRPVSSGLNALGVGGLAAGLSLGEIVRQMRELGDSTLNMKELGRQSGMTMDQIRRLNYVAARLHVDPSAVTNALKSWSNQMLDFRTTRSEFYRYLNFNNNGDVAKKIAADSPEQGFKDTLDYLSRIPAAAMKAGKSQADAMQIQKRVADMAGVGDMVPALANGPEGLRQVFAEAAREVKPMSEDLVAAAQKLNDAQVHLGQRWDNLMTDVGPKLINPLSGAIDKFDAVIKEGEKLFNHGPERDPPRKPDGTAGESVGERILRTGRNSLRATFQNNGLAEDGQWLWNKLFGVDEAHADEMPPGMRASASRKWAAPSRYGAEARARVQGLTYDAPNRDGNALRRNDEMPVGSLPAMREEIRQGSKEGIVAGLRELAQQQELGGGDPHHDGRGGVGLPNLRYGRDPASGAFRRGGRSGGGRGYADTPEGSGRPISGSMGDRAMSYMEYLVDKKGWTPEGAAILIGNGMQESNLNPGTRPGDPGTPGGSHYMFQWNNGKHNDTVRGRRALFERWARENGRSVLDPYANLDYADEERKHRSGLEAEWHRQTDLHNAGRLGHAFEGYGDRSEGTRVQNARNALAAFRRKHSGAGTPVPSSEAQTAADLFKARQRKLMGHAAGGRIRGAGTGTSDSIPAWLSDGEFVVNAAASAKWGPLLHAINGDHLPGFADGGEVAAGLTRHRSWRAFFRRPLSQGGMGVPDHVALGAMAMMMGESGRWLNPGVFNPNDVDGPSGGSAQWHDVVRGRYAGRIHRFSDLMRLALLQHEDWHSVPLQQANFKREALGPMAYAWNAMRRARTATGALDAGVRRFEVPANPGLEVMRRALNIVRLAREAGGGGGGTVQHEIDPLQVDIRHHPHTGQPIIQARAGRGVRLNLRTGPTMRPT